MEINKKSLRKIFFGVIGCIVLYWLLHETSRVKSFLEAAFDVISPFVAGAALAFILNVPMRGIEKLLKGIPRAGLRRALAILLTFIAIILVLIGVYFLLVPQLTDTVESLIATLPDFFARIQDSLTRFINENPEAWDWLSKYLNLENFDISEWIQRLVTWLGNSVTSILSTAITTVISLSTGIFNAILSLVFALYCLSKKEILARQGRRILYSVFPEKAGDETIRILRMTNSTFSNFISGQCLEALILGCMFAITMPIFRMPFVPLVSVIIMITALVPIVGAFVGCALGAFFILVQDPTQAFGFVILFLILQQIEGNLIYPKVVGTSIGLPGMWVLVAVAVGGDLMGVGGMLMMIPLSAVLYALIREFTNKRLAAKGIDPEKLKDQPPELRSGFKDKREKRKEKKKASQKAEKQDSAETKE